MVCLPLDWLKLCQNRFGGLKFCQGYYAEVFSQLLLPPCLISHKRLLKGSLTDHIRQLRHLNKHCSRLEDGQSAVVADSPGTNSCCSSALNVMEIRESCHTSFHFENVPHDNAIFQKGENQFFSQHTFFFFFGKSTHHVSGIGRVFYVHYLNVASLYFQKLGPIINLIYRQGS